jgi:hypothetical protein
MGKLKEQFKVMGRGAKVLPHFVVKAAKNQVVKAQKEAAEQRKLEAEVKAEVKAEADALYRSTLKEELKKKELAKAAAKAKSAAAGGSSGSWLQQLGQIGRNLDANPINSNSSSQQSPSDSTGVGSYLLDGLQPKKKDNSQV